MSTYEQSKDAAWAATPEWKKEWITVHRACHKALPGFATHQELPEGAQRMTYGFRGQFYCTEWTREGDEVVLRARWHDSDLGWVRMPAWDRLRYVVLTARPEGW